jgi:RNA polymerase sigma-70 factor (ECF subfamily)
MLIFWLRDPLPDGKLHYTPVEIEMPKNLWRRPLERIQTVEDKNKEFEDIAIQYMDSLYGTALRMTRDESDAQDLVQDSYLRAYQFFDRFERGTDFKAWLFAILRNIYINEYHRASRTPQTVDIYGFEASGILRAATTPEDEVFDELFDDEITSAMNSLPEDFRFAVILSDLEGFSYREIAEILHCPIGTVMSRLCRGRSLLRNRLYEYARKLGYVRN